MTIVFGPLAVRFGSTTLVNGVAFRLAPASRIALVGISGASKPLTCAALTGTLPAFPEVISSLIAEPDGTDAGSGPSVSSPVGGKDGGINPLGLPAALRSQDSRIAPVPQNHSTALHPLIMVDRQIVLAFQITGHTRDETCQRVTDYLCVIGLDEPFAGRVPGRLSGDQHQRISLAPTLAAKPAFIIVDELITALDAVVRAGILGLLSSLTNLPQTPALFLITHDLPTAVIYENTVVFHDGAIIKSGETFTVLIRPAHSVTTAMCEVDAEKAIDGALTVAGAAVWTGLRLAD